MTDAYTILENTTRAVAKGTIHLVRVKIKKSEYNFQFYASNHNHFADLFQIVKNWNFAKCLNFGSVKSAIDGTDGIIKEIISKYF